MRVANRTKDYTQIDALIREHIPKFLYNDGEGKLVKKERTILLNFNVDRRLFSFNPLGDK